MNWDNQNNQDPWGRNNNNNDGPNFDDLMKQFSLLFGGNKNSTNGSGVLAIISLSKESLHMESSAS